MKNGASRTVLITGGAGFIGSNLAERLLTDPRTRVRIFDNFSRQGVQHNIKWLQSLGAGKRLEIVEGDVRDTLAVRRTAADANEIYHLAAQVAVTTSVEDPATDFEVNVRGTFNMLEAARLSGRRPFVLFTSTNKVYGSLERLSVEVEGAHYRASLPNFCGVNESEPLDFHSPYGCSKGAADQYVRDYARIYGLPTVVFRMSCIAGPRQFGNEDQGWVAHFLYSVLAQRPITIYGNGCQVRDVLHVADLMDAMMAARDAVTRTRGQVFNLGGGMDRAISVIEMLRQIEEKTGCPLHRRYKQVRPGDQPLYVSDTGKMERYTGWTARRTLAQTLDAIYEFWLENHEKIFVPATQIRRSAGVLAMEVA
ncbi:MAG: GDP-mannose 4,6-dehydratase [Silvibacterium sp.]|nr:GDP-mannose 4,6-dehydratase [Silvibacterium sp.]